MKNQPEFQLQCAVCEYLEMQFPKILYMSDTVASLKLTFPQMARNKKIQKSDFHCPDLMILEPRKGYHGLFIELKVVSPYLKDGKTLKKSDHLTGQQDTLIKLNLKGYHANFATGFDEAKEIIDNYLKG